MYSIAICDKDASAGLILQKAIEKVKSETVGIVTVRQYTDAQSLFQDMQKYPEKYNLLFLETMLEPYDGIELAEKLRKNGYRGFIAFATGSRADVFRAFDVDACQYFLKPVSTKKLQTLFSRLPLQESQRSRQYLSLQCNANFYKIPHDDISYIETVGRKVAIHTWNDIITYPCKLSELIQVLPEHRFIRCHQSYVVQEAAVDHISNSLIHLHDGAEIPISRTYRNFVRERFPFVLSFKSEPGSLPM